MNSQGLLSKVNILYLITLIAAIIETVLLIPGIGGTVVVSMLWIPLIALIGLYITGLIYVDKALETKNSDVYADQLVSGKKRYITGIICGVLAFIPFLGWVLHIVMAILMWTQFSSLKKLKNTLIKENTINGDDNAAE